MCGICGVVQLAGEPRQVLAPVVLDRMTDSMTHRGPNDRGTYLAPGVALGVRRLSIVDVEGGHQPFASEDERVWAIQNGELYNHSDLRAELRGQGHRFRSRCDTEVIPHLYEQVGDAFPERLRGKFGLAVWDGRRRRAVLARDRLGVKPLYYARCGDLLVFASELKAVLASGLVGDELDYEAIDAYLTFGYVPAPRTPLAAVKKLLPGQRLVIENGHARADHYWRYPKPEPETPARSKDEYAQELLDLLEESVRLRLMSDVPLGAMLSGGLDSSLIVALMARNMAEPVKTFSVGFAEDEHDNELADADHVANVYGTDHHQLQLSFSDTIDLEQLVWHLDEPVADLSALGFHALSQLAAQHVTVALSGQGADELLGGYERYRNARLAEQWARLPHPLRTLGGGLARLGPPRARRVMTVLSMGDPVSRYLMLYGGGDEVSRLRRPDGPLGHLDGRAAARAVEDRLDGFPRSAFGSLVSLDGQLHLADDLLHYFDRASMAHSLEVRVPFLDHHLVEYAARIPANLKVRRLTTKYLLKHAARGLVPDHIIDKRKIGFFRGTSKRWLEAKAAAAMSDYLLRPDPQYATMLDRAYVAQMVSRYRANGQVNAQLMLSILILEVWLSSFLPRARAASVARDGRLVA
jgi:asparagine synthase (glutamine-hydrolysing)